MIPKKIQPYFKTTRQTRDGDNSIIEGILTCCNDHDFEVLVVGEIKHSMFSKMRLFPENDKTVIEVRCRKCGKVISIFDSSCDGYEQCGSNIHMYKLSLLIAGTAEMEDFLLVSNMNILIFKNLRNLK